MVSSEHLKKNLHDHMLKQKTHNSEQSFEQPNVKIISEIGINHNGSMKLCKQLIALSQIAGVDYVKIQKRNPDICVPEHQKSQMRDTPWGKMTYLEYKKKIEFSEPEIIELHKYATEHGVTFFASVWDKDSVDLMAKYTTIAKIPSALITDLELCNYARNAFDFLIISTGMSTEEEIDECIASCNPDVIMHTNSTYPCSPDDLNLNYICHLKNKYPEKEIGYSGHEYGLVTTFATIPMGATWIERHITLDHKLWGSDQLSSIEPSGLLKLVKGIRDIEKSLKYPPQKRIQFPDEDAKRKTLRK